ncbi:hypothetical protein KM043_013341 [Ampulex compressa]|nr:hypothetical protein KM043_013341 [Ampulex compressa]
MIRVKEELVEKLGLEGGDDTHGLLNNMVDVRACYKPSSKFEYALLIRSRKADVYSFRDVVNIDNSGNFLIKHPLILSQLRVIKFYCALYTDYDVK